MFAQFMLMPRTGDDRLVVKESLNQCVQILPIKVVWHHGRRFLQALSS